MKINKFNHDIEQEAAWADRLVSENNWLKHTIEARDTEIEALEAENQRLRDALLKIIKHQSTISQTLSVHSAVVHIAKAALSEVKNDD